MLFSHCIERVIIMIKFIIMIKYKQGQALPSGVTLGPFVVIFHFPHGNITSPQNPLKLISFF